MIMIIIIIANAGPLNWPHHPIKSFSAHKSILPFLKDLNIPAKKNKMSHVMIKPAFCICENKGADQLIQMCSKRAADQRFCFHHKDSTIPLLSKSEISSL